jgi:hypothetical protein
MLGELPSELPVHLVIFVSSEWLLRSIQYSHVFPKQKEKRISFATFSPIRRLLSIEVARIDCRANSGRVLKNRRFALSTVTAHSVAWSAVKPSESFKLFWHSGSLQSAAQICA